MRATAVSILVLAAFVAGGPVGAAPPKQAEDLGREIAALTEAISAQLKLLTIYEEMDKTADVMATKKTLLGLLASQQRAIGDLREALGGERAAWMKVRAGKRRMPPIERVVPRVSKDAELAPAPANVREVVDRGLAWLAAHQDPKGYWDADGWMIHDGLGVEAGAGYVLYDPGVTGLATLAFLSNAQTHKSGDYKNTVKSAMRYLKQIQDPEGCFGPRTYARFTYNHAICALAMIEGYALTESPLFKQSAQSAVDFIHKAQNPYMGWRYGVRPKDNDTSVTGWMVAALFAARRAGLRVDDSAFEGAMAWIDKATEPEYGRVGYTARGSGPARPEGLMDKFPPDKSEALTAVGLSIRFHCDATDRETYAKGIDLCLKQGPDWNRETGAIDMYYWYWGTMGLRRYGGAAWKHWRKLLVPIVREHQRRDAPFLGSFDPVGVWGREGGRVYSTALMTMVASMIEIRRWVEESRSDKPFDGPGTK